MATDLKIGKHVCRIPVIVDIILALDPYFLYAVLSKIGTTVTVVNWLIFIPSNNYILSFDITLCRKVFDCLPIKTEVYILFLLVTIELCLYEGLVELVWIPDI